MRIGIDGREQYAEKRGIGRYVHELCRALHPLLPDAEFFIYSNMAIELPVRSRRWTLRTDPSRWGRRLSPLLWLKLRAGTLARRDRLDVFWGATAFLPRLPKSVRTVVCVHDLCHIYTPETFDPIHLLGIRMFFGADIRRADVVLATSNGTMERLEQRVSRRADAIVSPAVGEMFQRASQEVVARCRERYGLPESYILTVAAWERRKNIATLTRAFLSLQRKGMLAQHRLVLVGKGSDRASGELLGLLERDDGRAVTALGFVPDEDLPALYSGADAFVLASLYEGFGIPVVEARACGTRVVVTDMPELREAGGNDAVYIEPSEEGIRRGLMEALARPIPSAPPMDLPDWQDGARTLARFLAGSARAGQNF